MIADTSTNILLRDSDANDDITTLQLEFSQCVGMMLKLVKQRLQLNIHDYTQKCIQLASSNVDRDDREKIENDAHQLGL